MDAGSVAFPSDAPPAIQHSEFEGRQGARVALFVIGPAGGEVVHELEISISSPHIGADERAAVDRVLRSRSIAQGAEVELFEEEFSPFAGDAECVAVNSGTAALHLGLLAAGVGPGDEVIVPSFTFAATANAVALTGAKPVFADIDPTTFCLDPAAAEAAISPRTVAMMPVHLFGHPASMRPLCEIADRHGLALFEDAAQAHMASAYGKRVGSFGLLGAFSFYPTKNMTSGEGGMVTTFDGQLARKVRLLRNQGMERRYENELIGFNARMTDIHAAIGRVQLKRLAAWTESRRVNAQFYNAHLRGVVVPVETDGSYHVYHQYTVRVQSDDREEVVRRLATSGIGTGVYYPTPVHRLASFGLRDLDLPETTRASEEVLSLPVHPKIRREDLERVVENLMQTLGAGV